MQFSQWLLVNVPFALLFFILVIFSVALSVVGLFLIRRFIPHKRLKIHNDVAGPIFSTFGVIYAVLLAFTVIVTWENFDRSKQNVEREANCLVDLRIDSEAFTANFGQQVRKLFSDYANTVINDEWPLLAKGENSPKVDKILKDIWILYSGYSIRNQAEEAFFNESVRKMNELSELRMTRLMDSRSGIQPVLWAVLLIGGIITVVFTFLFGTENFGAQMTMIILLALLIALILFTILVFDYPFSGSVSVSAEPFVKMMNL